MPDASLSTVLRQLRHLAGAPQTNERTDGQLLDAFFDQHDEAAFASLVRRHGPMVLGVCRRVLHDWHAAEDAFQATFLVLFRRARALDRRGSLAGWLHTVAYHAALKARAGAARRQWHERQVGAMPPSEPNTEVIWRDLQPVLDEEMQTLPEKYRLPVLLCYVEGKTNTEAARLLGWPAGTLKSRLTQARQLLRQRLTRRGITVTATALAAALAGHATAAVPSLLVDATVKTVVLAGGKAVLATPAAKLAESILRGMAAKGKIAALVLLGLMALGLGGGIWARQAGTVAPEERPMRQSAVQPPGTPKHTLPPLDLSRPLAVRGQVLGPDGMPAPRARLAILALTRLPVHSGDLAAHNPQALAELTADAHGRFQWRGVCPPLGTGGEVYLLAKSKGYGLTWAGVDPAAAESEQTLRLAPERVLHIRLFDLQGQPAAGVGLRFNNLDFGTIMTSGAAHLPPPWPGEPVYADRDGRIAVSGFDGRYNLGFEVCDSRFAMQWVTLTAAEAAHEVTRTLAPAQIIEGTIVAADTGKPLPGCRVAVSAGDRAVRGSNEVTAPVDNNGHFRINTWPGKDIDVLAFPPDGSPYLILRQQFTWPKRAIKKTLEMRLPHGILVRGKITEASTGQPVGRAMVQYWLRDDNRSPLRRQIAWRGDGVTTSDSAGCFALAVLPGRGALLVSGPTPDFIHQETSFFEVLTGRPGEFRLYPDAIVKLNLPPNAQQKEITVALRRGVTVRGSIMGPDGKRVDEAIVLWRPWVAPLIPSWYGGMKARGGRFELHGLDPNKSDPGYILDPKNRNAAKIKVARAAASKDLTMRLQPCGQARIRYVNQRGKPLAGQRPMLFGMITPGPLWFDRAALDRGEPSADYFFVANEDRLNYGDHLRSGADGRCLLPALIPGCSYLIQMRAPRKNRYGNPADWRQFRVRSGQTLDLGDAVIEQ